MGCWVSELGCGRGGNEFCGEFVEEIAAFGGCKVLSGDLAKECTTSAVGHF